MTDPNERDRMEEQDFRGLSQIPDEEWEEMRRASDADESDRLYNEVHESAGELAAQETDNDEEGH